MIQDLSYQNYLRKIKYLQINYVLKTCYYFKSINDKSGRIAQFGAERY